MFTNFVVEEINIQPAELGALESIREIPGLLSVLIAAATMMVAEPMLAGLALGLMAFGVANYFHLDSMNGLVLFSLIWSVGFHTWAPLSMSMALRYGNTGEEGRRLGLLRSSGAVAGLIGIGLVFMLNFFVGYRPMFVIAGLMIGLGGLIALSIQRRDRSRTQKIVLRKQYWLFYLLQIMNGTRRHIFMTFAIFALVRLYGTDIQAITILSLVNQVFSIAAAYWFGSMIDKYGERRVFAPSMVLIALVFLGYALIDSVTVLFVLYVIDNILFSNSIAISTYGKKILITESDLRPTMVAGQTMNHVAAVIVPITGGLMWETYGHSLLFIAGSIIAVLTAVISLTMRDHFQASDSTTLKDTAQ